MRFAYSLSLAALFFLSYPYVSFAGAVPCGGPGQRSCEICESYAILEGFAGYAVFTIAPLIAVLAIMIYALGMMLKAAEQNPAGVLKYKRAITAAVIGLCFIFMAAGIVTTMIGAMDPSQEGIYPFKTYTECVKSK